MVKPQSWPNPLTNEFQKLLADLGVEGVQRIRTLLNKEGGQENPFRVLGVDPRDPAGLVSEVYRLKAKWFHPDNPRTGNDLRFRQIKAAYEAIKGTTGVKLE